MSDPMVVPRVAAQTLIIFLLVAWLVLAVLGAVIEGLFWLTVVGVVLFLGTAAFTAVTRRKRRVVGR